jgi:ribonucleoside-diphosphate reductase alpha chain
MAMSNIRKRDGSVAAFEAFKIASAIEKAFNASGEGDPIESEGLAAQVVLELEQRFTDQIPSVEDVQDLVEETLISSGFSHTAKAYILYRQERTEIRQMKDLIGVRDELKLTVNASHVLKKRYLLKDEKGQVVETPLQMFRRVARAVAEAERGYDSDIDLAVWEDEFYQVMMNLEFLPNSPTLMNAGTGVGQLSACFVIPVDDSIPGIFDAVKHMALVHKSGGGTGFSFSGLRPRGDVVMSTMGIASGPLSFMRIFDITTDVIKQGGRRRGANMGILRCDHPDIVEFITAKDREEFLTNFNLSVAVTDEFMQAVEDDQVYFLRNPRSGVVTGSLHARDVFRLIVTQAWRTGDPGLIFIDVINRANPTPHLGALEATNPCGEQPLLPFESCNLGSLNLLSMVDEGSFNWDRFRKVINVAVRFLDNVIDINVWPLPQTGEVTRGNRKIGLGVMGLADALASLSLPYDSEEGLEMATRIAAFLEEEAHRASEELALERGNFPNHAGSVWDERGRPMRNATVTTIAPTGTISIIAGCSSGIEPFFAITFVRNVIEGTRLVEVNPVFKRAAEENGFYSNDLMTDIARAGTVRHLSEVPEEMRRIFSTAFDIAPEWHVRMQAAFQKHCDNAVSKTINFPADASIEDIDAAYRLAYRHGCKGITVYRYGSRSEQVLYLGTDSMMRLLEKPEYTLAEAEYAGGCPTPLCFF